MDPIECGTCPGCLRAARIRSDEDLSIPLECCCGRCCPCDRGTWRRKVIEALDWLDTHVLFHRFHPWLCAWLGDHPWWDAII